jgi:hypothetical protein
MHTFRKLFAAAAIVAVAAGSASAHGAFHGGGAGGFGHGFGGDHGGRGGEYGYHRHYGWDYEYYALPGGGESYCQDGFHIGSDGRCWPDKH